MRRGVHSLASVAAVAPFFGFFGTVVGIMNSLRSFDTSKSVIMAHTADGISQALAPTVLGILVALLAYCFHRYLNARMQAFDVEINCQTKDLLNHLTIYVHRLRIADPVLGNTLSRPLSRAAISVPPKAKPLPPRLRFQLERMYRHGLLELLWPKLRSPLDAMVVAEAAGGLCGVYGLISLLSFWLHGRLITGVTLAGFFLLAGFGIPARRRKALLWVYAFLLIAACFSVIAFGPSFVSWCSVAAIIPLIGAWKALGSETRLPSVNQSDGALHSVALALATVAAIVTVAFGTVLFTSRIALDDVSMGPTVLPGDRLFGVGRPLAGAVNHTELWEVNTGTYGTARVIGLPGDDIQIRVGKLIRNGVPVDEPYSDSFADALGDFPLPSEAYDGFLRGYHDRAYGDHMTVLSVYRVPADHYFLLNDHRKELWDSRLLGPISRDQLVAKLLVLWRPGHTLFNMPHLLWPDNR
jgi:signal peptidase I